MELLRVMKRFLRRKINIQTRRENRAYSEWFYKLLVVRVLISYLIRTKNSPAPLTRINRVH